MEFFFLLRVHSAQRHELIQPGQGREIGRGGLVGLVASLEGCDGPVGLGWTLWSREEIAVILVAAVAARRPALASLAAVAAAAARVADHRRRLAQAKALGQVAQMDALDVEDGSLGMAVRCIGSDPLAKCLVRELFHLKRIQRDACK